MSDIFDIKINEEINIFLDKLTKEYCDFKEIILYLDKNKDKNEYFDQANWYLKTNLINKFISSVNNFINNRLSDLNFNIIINKHSLLNNDYTINDNTIKQIIEEFNRYKNFLLKNSLNLAPIRKIDNKECLKLESVFYNDRKNSIKFIPKKYQHLSDSILIDFLDYLFIPQHFFKDNIEEFRDYEVKKFTTNKNVELVFDLKEHYILFKEEYEKIKKEALNG